eukprot:457900-Pyramimonas_sp.AAC.1
MYSTFTDETLNLLLRDMARYVHRSTFERRVFFARAGVPTRHFTFHPESIMGAAHRRMALILMICSVSHCISAPSPMRMEAMEWAEETAAKPCRMGIPHRLGSMYDSDLMILAVAEEFSAHMANIPRQYHSLEMFSGSGGITKALRGTYNAESFSFERRDYDKQCACRLVGMGYALWMIGAILVRGCVHFSPQ